MLLDILLICPLDVFVNICTKVATNIYCTDDFSLYGLWLDQELPLLCNILDEIDANV